MTSLSRACKGCNQLKVRCQPSAPDPHVCERCLLGGRACVPADKRRRPRDRIAELEAQVAVLSHALETQKLSAAGSASAEPADTRAPPRACRDAFAPAENVYSFGCSSDALSTGDVALTFLDERVPLHAQHDALDAYRQRCQHMVPCLTADTDLDALRRDRPILLFTMAVFSSAPSIPAGDVRTQLLREVTCMFAAEVITQPDERPDIVWALLIACFWFRARPGRANITVHQLAHMANSLSNQLCTSGPRATREARLAFLASFMVVSGLALAMRRRVRNVAWTRRHDACLQALTSASRPEDELFLHIIRGERLCYRVAQAVHLCEPEYGWDLAVDTVHRRRTVADMQIAIDDWTATSCRSAGHKCLLFYRYAAIIYLHEPVLHTATNKMTFGAPFRAEKMAPTDFARPPADAVTGGHVNALYALRDACHALLDLATGDDADVARFLADSPLPFVAKVFHAMLVLAKLHIAVTGRDNTYGAVLRPDELRLAQYPDRVARLAASCEMHNPGALNGRIFACCSRLGDWLSTYDANVNAPLPARSLPALSPPDGTPPSDGPATEPVMDMPTLDASDAAGDLDSYLTAYDHDGFGMDEVEWQLLDKYFVDVSSDVNR